MGGPSSLQRNPTPPPRNRDPRPPRPQQSLGYLLPTPAPLPSVPFRFPGGTLTPQLHLPAPGTPPFRVRLPGHGRPNHFGPRVLTPGPPIPTDPPPAPGRCLYSYPLLRRDLGGRPTTLGSPALAPGPPLPMPPPLGCTPPSAPSPFRSPRAPQSLHLGAPAAGSRAHGAQSRARSHPRPLCRVQGAAGLGRFGPLDPNFLGRRASGDDRRAGGTTRNGGAGGRGAEGGPGGRSRKPGAPTYLQQQQQQRRGEAAARRAHGGPGRVGSAGLESGGTSRNSQVRGGSRRH